MDDFKTFKTFNIIAITVVILASVCGIIFCMGLMTSSIYYSAHPDEWGYGEKQSWKVERVFYHGQGRNGGEHYSFLVREGNSLTTVHILGEVKILEDVPVGETMFVESQKRTAAGIYRMDAEIHVHSVKDVNGGGWDHGKYGSGQVVPVN